MNRTARRLILPAVISLAVPALILSACSIIRGPARTQPPAQSPAQQVTANPKPTPPSATPQAPVSIPAEYQAVYQELEDELAHFENSLNQRWNGTRSQAIVATELAFANGNVGEGLLNPKSLDNNRLLLDRLQAMGVKGVVLAIKYPLLDPNFPHSSEYLQFFKDIVAECRQHDMKVLVEAGAIFSGTPYSPVQVEWSRFSTASFLQGLQDQLLLIASEIKPDYLTLANEPTTEEGLTRLRITPVVWRDFISSTLKKLGTSGTLLVGAGTGTWENPAYINEILHMPGLDYIDLHIYPLNKDAALLERALNYALQAHAAGKRVTVSESWLWKATPEELGSGLGNVENIMNRDAYGFWSPLDSRFIQDIVKLADVTNMDFVSFFWMRNLFAYMDYDTTPQGLTPTELNRRLNQAALSSVQSDKVSVLGQYFQDLLLARAKR